MNKVSYSGTVLAMAVVVGCIGLLSHVIFVAYVSGGMSVQHLLDLSELFAWTFAVIGILAAFEVWADIKFGTSLYLRPTVAFFLGFLVVIGILGLRVFMMSSGSHISLSSFVSSVMHTHLDNFVGMLIQYATSFAFYAWCRERLVESR